jgi:hypothetical protein
MLSLAINMPDMDYTGFPTGHRGGVSSVGGLGGPFGNHDVPAPSMLGSKRQRMV